MGHMDSTSVSITSMLDVAIVVGTRPEAIKLLPVLFSLQKETALVCELWLTGQHTTMVSKVLDSFEVKADVVMESPNPSGSLSGLTQVLIKSFDDTILKRKPKMVVVQGDTTSAFVAALVAFYHKIKIVHVEAGLRTGHKYAPFPEEINRSLITPLSDIHFAPTKTSANNLIKEGVPSEKIHITGNTVIDALMLMVEKVRKSRPALPCSVPLKELAEGRKMVLITGHRRENFGDGFGQICEAIRELSQAFLDVIFMYPVHLNQNVQEPVMRILSNFTKRISD